MASGARSSGTLMPGSAQKAWRASSSVSKPRVSKISSRPRPTWGDEVDLLAHPLAVGGTREGIEQAGPGRLFLVALAQLHHELDARLLVALGRDAVGEAQAGAARDVHGEAVAAGGRGVEGGADDVVDADALAGLPGGPGRVAPADLGLQPRRARTEQVDGPGRRRAGGEHADRRRAQDGPASAPPHPSPPAAPCRPSKDPSSSTGRREADSCLETGRRAAQRAAWLSAYLCFTPPHYRCGDGKATGGPASRGRGGGGRRA